MRTAGAAMVLIPCPEATRCGRERFIRRSPEAPGARGVRRTGIFGYCAGVVVFPSPGFILATSVAFR